MFSPTSMLLSHCLNKFVFTIVTAFSEWKAQFFSMCLSTQCSTAAMSKDLLIDIDSKSVLVLTFSC